MTRPPAHAGLFARVGDRLAAIVGAGRVDARTAAAIQRRYTLLGGLAAADGIVTTYETDWVNAVMERDALGLSERAIACAAFDEGRRARGAVEAASEALARGHECGAGGVAALLDDLVVLALADARLRPAEIAWLHRLAGSLDVDVGFVDRLIGRWRSSASGIARHG